MTTDKDLVPVQAPRDGTKLYAVLKQLQAKNGTTIKRLCKVTGWQPHSVRAALTGLRKRGYSIVRTPKEARETRYSVSGA